MTFKPLKNRDLNDFGIESDVDSDLFDCCFKSSSVTDCTGLIPSMPETGSQKDAYDELYEFRPDTKDKKTRKNDPIEM